MRKHSLGIVFEALVSLPNTVPSPQERKSVCVAGADINLFSSQHGAELGIKGYISSLVLIRTGCPSFSEAVLLFAVWGSVFVHTEL